MAAPVNNYRDKSSLELADVIYNILNIMLKMVDYAIMLARYVIYFLFPKKRNRFNRLLYTCVHTSSLLKLGSNFREICLARRVSTARSHP